MAYALSALSDHFEEAGQGYDLHISSWKQHYFPKTRLIRVHLTLAAQGCSLRCLSLKYVTVRTPM